MKTAFKILPQFSSGKNYDLLVEAGSDGISLVWYSKQPLKIEGILILQAPKDAAGSLLTADLQRTLAAEEMPHYNAVNIYYNFKQSLIVPDVFYKEANSKQMLDLVYGNLPGNIYYAEPVNGMQCTNIYNVPSVVHEALTNRFFSAVNRHSNSCLIKIARSRDLYCIVYNNYIKVILYKNEQLQLVQLYDYNTPSDAAYHLLNVCSQHSVVPADITLTLSGFIDQQSSLYEELYRYFLHVHLEKLPEGIEVDEGIRSYPDHFFSSLINLLTCV